jgi:uncharacterized protein (DUF3084 family)
MNIQDILNKRYQDMCTQIGHLEAQIQSFQSAKSKLLEQVSQLDNQARDLVAKEQQVLAEAALAAKTAPKEAADVEKVEGVN